MGTFEEVAEFGTTTHTSKGGSDVFLAKYDASGQAVWAKQAGGPDDDGDQALGQGIALDGRGNCYITGTFKETIAFGTTKLTSRGFANMLRKWVLWSHPT